MIRINLITFLKMQNAYTWLIEPYFESWDIGKSNTVTVAPGVNVIEPRSETRNVGINMQLVIPL